MSEKKRDGSKLALSPERVNAAFDEMPEDQQQQVIDHVLNMLEINPETVDAVAEGMLSDLSPVDFWIGQLRAALNDDRHNFVPEWIAYVAAKYDGPGQRAQFALASKHLLARAVNLLQSWGAKL